MKTDLIEQFNHTWNILEGMCRDCDADAWTNLAHGYIMPARLAFHILLSTLYYLEDDAEMFFASGKPLAGDWLSMELPALPSQSDILQILPEFREKTDCWLAGMDLAADNTAFSWAGSTKLGVVTFLLRHTLYHTGELNALLYESKNGAAEDNWIKAFR